MHGKRFIVYDLVERLQQQNSHLILTELTVSLNTTEIKEGKLHGAFETLTSIHACSQSNIRKRWYLFYNIHIQQMASAI